MSLNSFDCRRALDVDGKRYTYYDLNDAAAHGLTGIERLPSSLKVLLENLLRFEDGETVTKEHIHTLARSLEASEEKEICFRPARVLMQDFTGVPAVADLAAMRAATEEAGYDPALINPLVNVDLVIDHSVMVDRHGSNDSFDENVALEMARNSERYRFLRWGQQAFDNFRVVPPGTGICHQVNLEYLARVVWESDVDGVTYAYPDTLVGTDSHTTMINGLGVLGWGVGGIEAEAAMLGQPLSMLIPQVVGVHLTGCLREGITSTDLVLKIVEMLREHGVVGKFVEFHGDALRFLTTADRATIANMAPEYGATCGYFPPDERVEEYLRQTGRGDHEIALMSTYCEIQGLGNNANAQFASNLALDLESIEPVVAGPSRPQDRVTLHDLPKVFSSMPSVQDQGNSAQAVAIAESDYTLSNGAVVIAAITSCTNTSNPAVMLAAGLVARRARELGLSVKPWVKTSLAPGSRVVTEYLEKTKLQDDLDAIGFNLVGYGCTTCIGNSGPLAEQISKAISDGELVVSAVLSGNRNFEGRVHQEVKANWLASPPLVVAFALAGTTRINLEEDSLGTDQSGKPVYLRDLWPSTDQIDDCLQELDSGMFSTQYEDVFNGTPLWQEIEFSRGPTYSWHDSTYIKQPPFFSVNGTTMSDNIDIQDARILAILGDSVTTDHISPAGAIQPTSPAGEYLQQNGVQISEFNSYGSRRGNHEVMMRGTFANIRIRNRMIPDTEGGFTLHIPSGDRISIYDAAIRYAGTSTPLVVVAGKEYGTGSSRDWAAKGTRLLGIKAVIAESFERIHRSNLVGMGVLPLQFKAGDSAQSLMLRGDEKITIEVPNSEISPKQEIEVRIERDDGTTESIAVVARIDTKNEIEYFRCGGILQYVLDRLVRHSSNKISVD